MTETLAEKTCTPCRGGIPPLTRDEAQRPPAIVYAVPELICWCDLIKALLNILQGEGRPHMGNVGINHPDTAVSLI